MHFDGFSRKFVHVFLFTAGIFLVVILTLQFTGICQNKLFFFVTKICVFQKSYFGYLTGVVHSDDSKSTSRKLYEDTLINSYPAEALWYPVKSDLKNPPSTAAKSAVLIDLATGTVLYEKNSEEKLKIASLTKIMTAVIALEHKGLKTEVTISEKAASVGENSMEITTGEKYSLEELLYGLILHSGNDAAFAIAESVAGDPETFVDFMNIKARELGLTNTYFADPSGLDDNTYSTVTDLVRLTRYALKNPDFRKIVKTWETELTGSQHKYIYLQNQTNLLRTYPGVQGVKTGYTEDAGLCLVSYATNNNKEVVGVVLDSIDRKGDMILMLDYGYNQLGVKIRHNLLD